MPHLRIRSDIGLGMSQSLKQADRHLHLSGYCDEKLSNTIAIIMGYNYADFQSVLIFIRPL